MIYSSVGNLGGMAMISANLAVLLRHERDLRGARREMEKSISLLSELRDEGGTASSLHNLAFVLLQLGELPEALARGEQALAIRRQLGLRDGIQTSLSLLAEVRMNGGDLDRAHALLAELFASPGLLPRHESSGHSVLAHLLLAEGRPDAAIQEARKTVALLRTHKKTDSVVELQALIARALLEQGKPAEAAQELEPPLVAPGEDKSAQLELSMARALVSAHAGKAGAREQLRALAQQAAKDGFALDSMQARLDLSRLDGRKGNPRAKGELRRIAREAGDKGYQLIARSAARSG